MGWAEFAVRRFWGAGVGVGLCSPYRFSPVVGASAVGLTAPLRRGPALRREPETVKADDIAEQSNRARPRAHARAREPAYGPEPTPNRLLKNQR